MSKTEVIKKDFNGMELTIIPNNTHEFLLSTAEVAKGYGVSLSVIRESKRVHIDELIEDKHFLKGVRFSDTLDVKNAQPHQIFWTKRGIVRLGFFIKSERAKLFRDWAEDLIIEKIEPKNTTKEIEDFLNLINKHNINETPKADTFKDKYIALLEEYSTLQKGLLANSKFNHNANFMNPNSKILRTNKIIELYMQGIPYKDIAKSVNRTERTIHYTIARERKLGRVI